jgi:hypothetical protein
MMARPRGRSWRSRREDREIRAASLRAGSPAAERLRGPGLQAAGRSTPAAFKEAQVARRPHRRCAARRRQHLEAAQPAEAQPRGEWWLAFNDARLDSLIAQATASNQNLAVAAAA